MCMSDWWLDVCSSDLKGGGGNFGVVVRFEFALHPIGPEVMFAAPIYALDDGPGPIRAWREFLGKHGDRVGSLCEFSTAGGEDFPAEYRGKRVYALACVYNGDAAEGETLLQPLRELGRSEEHTSELQSLMRISYAVFCLKKKKKHIHTSEQFDKNEH